MNLIMWYATQLTRIILQYQEMVRFSQQLKSSNMTSIEWLEEKLNDFLQFEYSREWDVINKLIEQAKEMHKKEIIDAWKMGRYDSDKIVMTEKFYAEQYYQQTFKKELTSQLPGINVNDVKPSNPQMIKENFSPKQK
jgi:hypothetical protein